MDACIHPCMYVCMHGYPPIQYLLYTTPMHVPYTIYHVSYTTFISHHVTPCHALLPLTPTSTVYHTFMSHHITSCHVMSCHVMHSYHIPYIPCTIYHVPLVFMSSTLPNLSLLCSTPLYSKCTSTVSLPSNVCISQLCIDSTLGASYSFVLPRIDTVWYNVAWHGVVLHGMAWCGMACISSLPLPIVLPPIVSVIVVFLLPSRASVSIKHPFFLVHHVHVCMYMHVSLV
jgi:hypothetical protein